MSNSHYDDYDNRLLSDGSENVEEFEENTESEVTDSTVSDEYYELPVTLKSRNLIWSVISFVCGVLSIALCPLYYISLVFAVGAVVTSLVSRKNLGFFEKYAIFGLILGIMGVVFGISAAIAIRLGIFG
jgi:hypothetical protein